ncbi:DEAD/DEAH box helicase [Sutcliffiella cohnii]|uniref:DEAD/DEAH box helicase n=1 Tax=Sutcliffiella cohnii TaxID=33932 RepID=UPI002E211FFD|nr:AAA domain-containing protein [Sutcliffiella cohnii]MED4018653.1 AAA domain-containing protein [Sutcliffiella cohnii]
MTSTHSYIKQWQKALQIEVQHLKKWGSTKYQIINGHYMFEENNRYHYYFETIQSLKIPNGSIVKFQWGKLEVEGRIISSEQNSVIITVEKFIGDLIQDAFLSYDPWELLVQLIDRLEESKDSKKKRSRIKRLMNPTNSFVPSLVKAKSNVEEVFLRSKFNPITFVWGPPGTGKTYTLARVAANLLLKNKSVLILSHSNQAVDVLLGETSSFLKKKNMFREGLLIRYGSPSSEFKVLYEDLTTEQLIMKEDPTIIEEKTQLLLERRLLKEDINKSFSKRDSEELIRIEKRLSSVIEKIRQKELKVIKKCGVIGTTLAKAATDPVIFEYEFDYIIIDEASMAYIPQIGFAATLGKKLIICGDFKQLAPIAQGRHELVDKWLKNDIFNSTGVIQPLEEGKLHPHLFLLKEQRRMHAEISAFTNKNVYHSLVEDYDKVSILRQDITRKAPFPNKASVLLDTSYTGAHCIKEPNSHSRANPWQLLLSFQLIHEAYMNGNRSIGYTTPYRAQAQLMEELINDLYSEEKDKADIIAATVHRFQGSERDVMIFDTVDSAPENYVGRLLTGQGSERLLNVAITRTKGKFIHVSDTDFMKKRTSQSKLIRKLLDHQLQRNTHISHDKIGTWIKHHHKNIKWMHAKKTEQVFFDIEHAKNIIMAIPDIENLPTEWINALNSRAKNTELTILSPARNSLLKHAHYTSYSFPFPFILIDNRYFWLGVPFEVTKNSLPPYVAVRLDSTKFAYKWKAYLPNS